MSDADFPHLWYDMCSDERGLERCSGPRLTSEALRSIGGYQWEGRRRNKGGAMFRLNDDDFESRVEAGLQHRVRGHARRLGAWLRRRFGRACAAGLWTLSPDGKLGC